MTHPHQNPEPTRGHPREKAPWEHAPNDPLYLSEEQETALLQRVEDQLLVEFRQNAAPRTSPLWKWLLGTMGAGVAVAAALMLVWSPPQAPPLQMQGAFQAQQVNPRSTPRTWRHFQAPKTRKGTLTSPKQWTMKVAGGTQLQLQQPNSRFSHVRLQKGHVDVHVIPRSMKQFTVRAAGVQVLVKGTRFTVERHPKWVRVEVWRGLVGVKTRGGKGFDLPRAEGVQITLASGRWRRYKLPPATHRSPSRRLQWLADNDAGAIQGYLHYLRSSTRYSNSELTEVLQQAADWAKQKKKYAFAYRWRWEVVRLGGDDSESALVDAADYCVRARQNQRQCLSLYRLYFRTWGKRKSPLFLNALWNLRGATSIEVATRIALLHKAQKTLHSTHRQAMLRTLARLHLQSGVSCTNLSKKTALPSKADRWLQKHCPSLFPQR